MQSFPTTVQNPKQFDELRAAAEKQLQDPAGQLPHHSRLLRLWHYPSFDSWTSFLVCVPFARFNQSESPMVVAATWNRQFDATRFNDPMKGLAHGLSSTPTISLKQASLSAATLDSTLRLLEQVALPIVLDRSIVLDGEEFGVETFGMLTAVRVRWHSNPGGAWLPLLDWFEETRTFLQHSLE